jgi:ketosteroid isomerase-like protein
MSQENVEIVRRAIEAFNERGDDYPDGLDAFYDASIEFHESPELPEPGIYKGSEAVAAYFIQFLDSFEDYRFDIEEIWDAGDNVLVFNRQHGRGKGSGAQVEMRNAWLFILRDRRIIQIRPYLDRAEALEAVGLSEQDARADS